MLIEELGICCEVFESSGCLRLVGENIVTESKISDSFLVSVSLVHFYRYCR